MQVLRAVERHPRPARALRKLPTHTEIGGKFRELAAESFEIEAAASGLGAFPAAAAPRGANGVCLLRPGIERIDLAAVAVQSSAGS